MSLGLQKLSNYFLNSNFIPVSLALTFCNIYILTLKGNDALGWRDRDTLYARRPSNNKLNTKISWSDEIKWQPHITGITVSILSSAIFFRMLNTPSVKTLNHFIAQIPLLHKIPFSSIIVSAPTLLKLTDLAINILELKYRDLAGRKEYEFHHPLAEARNKLHYITCVTSSASFLALTLVVLRCIENVPKFLIAGVVLISTMTGLHKIYDLNLNQHLLFPIIFSVSLLPISYINNKISKDILEGAAKNAAVASLVLYSAMTVLVNFFRRSELFYRHYSSC